MSVTARQIVLRPTDENSVFRRPPSKLLQGFHTERRGLHALALVAVAAAFFRTGHDLTDRADSVTLTLEHMEEILTELCEIVAKRSGGHDPLAEDGEAEAWRVFLALGHGDSDARSGFNSRTAVLRGVVNLLVEQSMLSDQGSGRSYVPTERFRLQLRDVLSNEIYRRCIGLLGISPEAGNGGQHA